MTSTRRRSARPLSPERRAAKQAADRAYYRKNRAKILARHAKRTYTRNQTISLSGALALLDRSTRPANSLNRKVIDKLSRMGDGSCRRDGAPTTWGLCLSCAESIRPWMALDEVLLGAAPSNSDAAARTPDPDWPLPAAPAPATRLPLVVVGHRVRDGVPEVCLSGLWTVSRNETDGTFSGRRRIGE